VLGVVAVVLGIAFEKQNIAFMVSLAFAIAASANFPVLFMSVLWKDCTTRGAVIGGFLGLISAVVLTVRVAVGVGSHAGQRGRFRAIPVRLAGAVLDVDRVLRDLVLLDHRPQQAGGEGTRRLQGAAGACRDRPGRLEVIGSLTHSLPHGMHRRRPRGRRFCVRRMGIARRLSARGAR
jgi:hypothetical protein